MSNDFYIEPLVGFRGWKLADNGTLESMYVKYSWGLEQKAAHHDTEWFIPHSGMRTEVNHSAPHQGCSCGYYALDNLENALDYFADHSGSIHMWTGGVVLCWGRVVMHQRGFRAEFAEPISLMTIDNADEEARAAYLRGQASMRYGIPILEPEAALEHALERGRLWK